MDKEERALQLLERAENLGLRFEFDGGLNTVKRAKSGDRDRQDDALKELSKYVREIGRLLQRRAIGARGNELLGRRICCAEGEGVLASADSNGGLTITITKEDLRRPITFMYNAESLLVIVDEEATAGDASRSDEPEPRKFLDRLRGSKRD